jgi:signal transduction histidine kinase
MINADQLKISQVIYNLLNNALNYSINDRKIMIIQHVIGKKVRIDVINKGHKIKSDDMPYVFDRYYRSKDHHIRALAGSGLGLAIVKSIIEQHEGTCFVESDDDQTKFSFELDIAL